MPFCNNCGADVEEDQKFCPECGARLKTEAVSPPPPPPQPDKDDTTSVPPPPPQYNNVPPPPPAGSQSNIPPPKQGILGRVDIDQEDIDEVAEKAKKGLGAAWRLARKGINKGAELASQGIEAAKDTIEERREKQQAGQAPPPAGSQSTKFCPNCGQPVAPGKFCNHCGHKLE